MAILYEVHGGGEGASAARDGGSAVRVHMSNVMNTPVEVVEAEYPSSRGARAPPGLGGRRHPPRRMGFTRAYRVLAPDVTLTSMLERRVVPPGARWAGATGAFRITLDPGRDGARRRGKETLRLVRDVVVIETCGGGGYGAPEADRPAARARPPGGLCMTRRPEDRIAIVS